MTCTEAQELITALVDHELPDPERSALEAHLNECARCRLVLDEERLLKQAVRGAGQSVQAPIELRNRILADPRFFSEKRLRWWDHFWPMPRILAPAFATALVLLAGFAVFSWIQQRKASVALAALETYDLFLRGKLSVQRLENTEELAQQLTRAVDGRFHPMGYDLTAMNLKPVAGLVREIKGRKILVAIYQGQGGSLFCYTFLGSEEDAPINAARFYDAGNKMNFYAFSSGPVNAVFHREGDLICILASEMPMEKLLALAQSKAQSS
jgi:anti-sigma factor (TIGR02949 family)